MKSVPLLKIASTVVLFCLATVVALPAQTFTTLFTFNGKDGAGWGNLIQGRNGNFYGAGGGGQYGQGEVYEITPEGKLRSIYSFCPEGLPCIDGSDPSTPIQAADGSFYGVTNFGGAYGQGVIFKLTAGGKFRVLHSFCGGNCLDGYDPWGFVQGFNGNLYGTTLNGGTHVGTIFEITPSGEFTTIYNFCSNPNCADGLGPGALSLGPNGNFYGTTIGPCSGCGTIFEVTPAGKLAGLYTLIGVGSYPIGTLGTDGSLYGTTYTTGCCALGGVVFKVTPEEKETTLYTFCSQTNCADGEVPRTLIQGTDANFYGITSFGGSNDCAASPPFEGCGTIFSITPTGTLSTLYSFCPQTNCPDGAYPIAAPVQATDGKFYGITTAGGDQHAPCLNTGGGCGTIYSLDTGLAPFIESNPTFGRVGYKINILGNNLTGTTSVTFNGITATFTVVSNSYLRATVPTGATTGAIQVTTDSSTLTSNVPFRVLP